MNRTIRRAHRCIPVFGRDRVEDRWAKGFVAVFVAAIIVLTWAGVLPLELGAGSGDALWSLVS